MRRNQQTDDSTDSETDTTSEVFGRFRSSTDDRSSVEAADQKDHIPEQSNAHTADDSQGWLGRARAKYGLGALLVAAGVALFVFPEPVTSTAGLVLIGMGALIWLVSWAR